MGRQSSRLYFRGKDHKDIYYNGHYHDAMYLSDGEGNLTLVWEKLKGELIPYISMVSYVGGKYYLVAESSEFTTDLGYPVLYEGESLSKMKKRGLIFEDNPVRSRYHVMHSYLDRLIVIKTYNVSEKYIAVIPITNGKADMDNITYELDIYEYSGYTPYQSSEYIYRRGNYYYCSYNSGWRFYKNNAKLPYDIYFRDICINNDRLIAIGGLIKNRVGSDIPALQFGIFDDETDTIELKETSLEPVIKHLQDSEREGAIEYLKKSYNDYRYISDSIESVEASCREGEKFNNYFRASDSKWYKTVNISMKVKFNGMYRLGTHYVSTINDANYNAIYRTAINFDKLIIESYSRVNYDYGTYILSQLIAPQICVQITRNGADPARLNWGLPDEDYAETNSPTSYIGDYNFPDLRDITIASVSARGNELIVARNTSWLEHANFIVINTDKKTAYYKKIEAYEE